MRGWQCIMVVAALTLGGACGPKSTAEPKVVATESVRDPSGTIEVEMAYQSKGPEELDLVFRLRAVGGEEMDKLVLDLNLEGLHLLEGTTEWSGFVPPRQPQTHRVSLVRAQGAEHARATVSVRRSVDSELLMQRELLFRVTESGFDILQ